MQGKWGELDAVYVIKGKDNSEILGVVFLVNG